MNWLCARLMLEATDCCTRGCKIVQAEGGYSPGYKCMRETERGWIIAGISTKARGGMVVAEKRVHSLQMMHAVCVQDSRLMAVGGVMASEKSGTEEAAKP